MKFCSFLNFNYRQYLYYLKLIQKLMTKTSLNFMPREENFCFYLEFSLWTPFLVGKTEFTIFCGILDL